MVRLVVAAEDLPAGSKRVNAVCGARDMDPVARSDGDAAGQEDIVWAEKGRGPRPLELGERLMLVSAGIFDRIGYRGFRPEKKARIAGWRSRQRCEPARRFLIEARPPLVLLAYVRLDNAHVANDERVGGDCG